MFKHKARIIFIITFFLVLYATSQAHTFSNAYISFEIPDNWNCKLEQAEWVCRAKDPQEAKEAVIILAAKETGPNDTLELYESYMNVPINTVTKAGAALISNVKYRTQTQKINDQLWLDGFHQNSEAQNYFTRYLVTIKERVSILITFSVYNKFFYKYNVDFDNTIRSLKIVATKDFLKTPDRGQIINGGEIFSVINTHIDGTTIVDENSKFRNKSIFKNEIFWGGLLLTLAVLVYILIRK